MTADNAEPGWLAGLSYDLARNVRVRGSATRKIRFPSIEQLYDASTGNPLLEPERADEIEAGIDYEWTAAKTVISLSGFHTRAANFIERDSGAPFANRDRYRFSGWEAVVDTSAIPFSSTRVSYSFLDSKALNAGGGGAPLQNRPRHRAAIEANWRLPLQLTARTALQAVGRQVYFSRGSSPVAATAKGFAVADVSITRALSRRQELVFGVNNLFDQLYEQSYALPREGRAVLLTLRNRF
jgi:iron complex outermembrane receptor protein